MEMIKEAKAERSDIMAIVIMKTGSLKKEARVELNKEIAIETTMQLISIKVSEPVRV